VPALLKQYGYATACATKGQPSVQLYDMSQDDREQINVAQKHPEIVDRLARLLEKYVAEGRSTPGPAQPNDVAVDIWKHDAKPAGADGCKPTPRK
jgi:arylsulfatase A